jgi:hypothetical protein
MLGFSCKLSISVTGTWLELGLISQCRGNLHLLLVVSNLAIEHPELYMLDVQHH